LQQRSSPQAYDASLNPNPWHSISIRAATNPCASRSSSRTATRSFAPISCTLRGTPSAAILGLREPFRREQKAACAVFRTGGFP